MKLVGKAYWWWKDSHIDCRDWFILQELLHTRYAPHLEGPQFSDQVAECKEILADMVKILESKAVEVVEDPELEPEFDEKSEVVVELVSLQEKIFSHPPEVVELPIELRPL